MRQIYKYSFEQAKRSGELEVWKESQKENINCKAAIESAIKENFDGSHLGHDVAKSVIAEFGHDRVRFVLANTLEQFDHDRRFSSASKAWAKEFYIKPDKLNGRDFRRDFVVGSHPVVLDGFINQVQKAYAELKLWDCSHCNSAEEMDFVGKVMVIDPIALSDKYKSGDFQIFYATGGFGCSPTSSGRKVYGEFLVDGDESQFQRNDFIGELKAEHLPPWAAEKLEILKNPLAHEETEMDEEAEM